VPSAITPDEYLEALRPAIEAIDGVSVCLLDGVIAETEAGPVVLLHPIAFEDLDDLGTQEWHAALVLELVVLVKRATRGSRLKVMNLAFTVATALRVLDLAPTLPIRRAIVRGVQRGTFDSGVEPLGEAWEIATVEVYQDAVWWNGPEEADPPIDTVHLGRAPEIGTGHEDDYTTIIPADGGNPDGERP
jgi:hypothetical protein